jgi:hypothetical protein
MLGGGPPLTMYLSPNADNAWLKYRRFPMNFIQTAELAYLDDSFRDSFGTTVSCGVDSRYIHVHQRIFNAHRYGNYLFAGIL